MKSLLPLLLLLCPLFGGWVAAQTPFPDNGKVFNDGVVPKIFVTIAPEDLDEMYRTLENEDHYPVTVVFDNGRNPDTLRNVGLRLRGNTSLNAGKKSYKLSFNTFEPGRKYKGLEKMNINGEHNDPSVIRSKLGWDLCRQMGIPASRANHVELYLNGTYAGLYINVEHVDEEFVQLRFGPQVGNLYKCLWPATLEYLGADPNRYKVERNGERTYDLKTNRDEDDYSDLARFIDVLNNTPSAQLACELEQVFDVQNYLKVIALDVLTANWDGAIYNKNNFYLYSNPQSGKIHFIPYDLDNTFGIQWFGEWTERNVYRWAPDDELRPLYNRIMANEKYRAQYTHYLQTFTERFFNTGSFFQAIDARKQLIGGSVAADPAYPRDYGFTVADFDQSYEGGLSVRHVPLGLKEYIGLRIASARNQLGTRNATPIISDLRLPAASANQAIPVSVSIEDAEPVSATLVYTFNGREGQIPLRDDGASNDGAAGDGRFGAIISPLGATGTLYYHLVATDANRNSNRYPACDDLSLRLSANPLGLYINEFQANNETTVADETGAYEDWIELYNASDRAIDLGGFFLSDRADEPTKWTFPDYRLAAGEFLVVWADDDPGTFHANFKLDAAGEAIILSDAAGNVIDQVAFGRQNNDETTGRLPNGTGAMRLVVASPAASNELALSGSGPEVPGFSVWPNPTVSGLRLAAAVPLRRVVVYDLSGREVIARSLGGQQEELNVGHLLPGVYLLAIHFANGTVATQKIVKR